MQDDVTLLKEQLLKELLYQKQTKDTTLLSHLRYLSQYLAQKLLSN